MRPELAAMTRRLLAPCLASSPIWLIHLGDDAGEKEDDGR